MLLLSVNNVHMIHIDDNQGLNIVKDTLNYYVDKHVVKHAGSNKCVVSVVNCFGVSSCRW